MSDVSRGERDGDRLLWRDAEADGDGAYPDHGGVRDVPQVDDRIWSEHGDGPHRDRRGCATCHAAGKTFSGTPAVKTMPTNHLPIGAATCESCHAPANFTSFAGTPMNHAR